MDLFSYQARALSCLRHQVLLPTENKKRSTAAGAGVEAKLVWLAGGKGALLAARIYEEITAT